MFEILYNITNGFKVMGYVLLIYILFVLLFNENVENKFPFIASYLILLTQGIFVKESLNKSFDRYKKYLRLKNKRKYRTINKKEN
jgi:membrane protein DedA with SNARE-associated domain